MHSIPKHALPFKATHTLTCPLPFVALVRPSVHDPLKEDGLVKINERLSPCFLPPTLIFLDSVGTFLTLYERPGRSLADLFLLYWLACRFHLQGLHQCLMACRCPP